MQGMQMGTRQAAGGAQRPGDFNRATRQSIVTLPAVSPATANLAGQISRIQMPQSGFLAAIWLRLNGTSTTAGGGSTTVATYPQPPWSFIRRIRLYNNQGVELWNTTGWGAYLYQRTQRTGFDPATAHADLQFSSPTGTVTSRYRKNPTSLGAAATETWACAWYLPIAWGPGLQHGLQNLQDPAITYTLEITWGDNTDLYSASTNLTLSGVSVTPMVELYAVPAESVDLPKLAFTKQVLEDLQVLTAGSGDNTYKAVTGNVFTRIIHEAFNGATAAPVDPSAVTQLKLNYSQTQVPYVIDADLQLLRQRVLYGANLPQGVYCHELCCPLNLPELVGTRDVINSARLTDMNSILTLSGVSLSSGNLRTIREMLAANR